MARFSPQAGPATPGGWRRGSGEPVLFALAALLGALSPLPGRAAPAQQEPGSSAVARPSKTVVLAAAVENREETEKLAGAVESHVRALGYGVTVVWTDRIETDPSALAAQMSRAGRQHDAAMVFWCEQQPGPSDTIYLYFEQGMRYRILERRLNRAEQSVKLETTAVIVRSVLEALTLGFSIDVVEIEPRSKKVPARTSPEPQAGPPASALDRSPRLEADARAGHWLRLSLAYDLRTFSPLHKIVHGLGLGLTLELPYNFHAGIGYLFTLPLKIHKNDIAYEVRPHPISLHIGYLWSKGRLCLIGTVAAVIDYLRQQTVAVATETAAAVDNGDLLVSIEPFLYGEYRLIPRVHLRLGLGAQINVTTVEYIAVSATASESLDTLYRIRPCGQVGIVLLY